MINFEKVNFKVSLYQATHKYDHLNSADHRSASVMPVRFMHHLIKKASELLTLEMCSYVKQFSSFKKSLLQLCLGFTKTLPIYRIKKLKIFNMGHGMILKQSTSILGGSNYCYDLVRTAPSVSAPIALIPKQRRFRTEGHLLFVPFW